MSAAKPTAAAEAARALERDELLAELLGNMIEQLRAGQFPDVEAVASRHHDLAVELRELWGAALLAEGFASDVIRPSAISATPAASPRTTAVHPARSLAAPTRDRSIDNTEDFTSLPRRFGEYELLAELGRGGMGVVYEARQAKLDRIVALKMILRGELASAADLVRFRGEAEAAARLDHPAIVPVYEVGSVAGQPYFCMRYVAGTTLARRLSQGPLGSREAARLLVPVCRAIHHAHEQGLLHRDLKPSNILLDAEGRPQITDFGLAKRITTDERLTGSGMILGTPCYMAPEQAMGSRGEIGPASDVYGLGTILYECLCGRPPFQAASAVDTILLVQEQDPVPPHLLNRSVDRDLEMITLRCLQKPMELRYATAAALADDLEAYLAGEPVAARSGGLNEVLTRLFRETHHAPVLENWGLLWMWHSLVLLVICLLTNWLEWSDVTSTSPYLLLWTLGLGTWAGIFWALRRRAGPVTFVERQIAHIWAASILSSTMLFWIEMILRLPVLTLAPVLALLGGTVFLIKAGILSGAFYVQAVVLFLTAPVMALFPAFSHTIFGVVAGACFFVPGLKYYRQRRWDSRSIVETAPRQRI